jgi:hypothetical protein
MPIKDTTNDKTYNIFGYLFSGKVKAPLAITFITGIILFMFSEIGIIVCAIVAYYINPKKDSDKIREMMNQVMSDISSSIPPPTYKN